MRISDWSSDVCSSDLSRHPSNHALRRIDMLKHFQEHPLTSAETADFIGHLIEKYVTNQGKGFSWSLFFTLFRNRGDLFYIRKRSLPSLLKQIARESHLPFSRTFKKQIGRASCRERVCQYV